MKKTRIFTRGIFVIVLLTLAVFHSFPTVVWANSAMKEWSGADATGVAVTDRYCPITVKNEKSIFDIPMFPDNYYSDASHLNEYRASVTARYEFYNPKDYGVTATLAFPFGAFPEYVDIGNEDFYSPATLDRYGVKTTFFLVGFWAEKHPDLVRELVARGHEIGNHSATHPHMASLTRAQIGEELRRCSDLVASITGTPTTLFRPPYGEYNDDVVRVSREMGYECVQWNVDSLDWKNLGKENMVRQCTKSVNPGDIVLFKNCK